VDIAADGYDAVVRRGPARDNRIVAKRLAPSRRVLVASPDYLAAFGEPRSLADLEAHKAILYANRETDWCFSGRQGGTTVVRPPAGLRVNNGLVMRDATVAGLGITLLATFVIDGELANGALRIIDVGAEPETADVYLAYPRDKSLREDRGSD
jgi:DNA-binding transcriptional LysR family regulator